MRRRTKRRLVKIVVVGAIILGFLILTGNTPKPLKNLIDSFIPKATEIAQEIETKTEHKDTLSILQQAYENYTANETASVSEGLEIPKGGTANQYNGYTLSYNTKYKQADWVAYTLDIEELNTKNTGRTDDFREDPKVDGAHLEDYKNSGYDRGHLCPSADRTSSVELCSETYLLSNMSPQLHSFNAGLWLDAENAVRDAARKYKKIYIATGPVFSDNMTTIGSCCQIAVPEFFYKVILAFDNAGEAHMIALLCPQKYKREYLYLYATTVDAVEELTGLDFFYNLSDSIEDKAEATYDLADWPKSFSE
jgi:endonuclease G, mitochondrial